MRSNQVSFATCYPVWQTILQFAGVKAAVNMTRVNKLSAEYSDYTYGLIDIVNVENSIDPKFIPGLRLFLALFEKKQLQYKENPVCDRENRVFENDRVQVWIPFLRETRVWELFLFSLRGMGLRKPSELHIDVPIDVTSLMIQATPVHLLIRTILRTQNTFLKDAHSRLIEMHLGVPYLHLGNEDVIGTFITMAGIALSPTFFCRMVQFGDYLERMNRYYFHSDDVVHWIIYSFILTLILSYVGIIYGVLNEHSNKILNILFNIKNVPKVISSYFNASQKSDIKASKNLFSFFEMESKKAIGEIENKNPRPPHSLFDRIYGGLEI